MLNSEPIHAEKLMAMIPQIATRKLPLSIDVPAKWLDKAPSPAKDKIPTIMTTVATY